MDPNPIWNSLIEHSSGHYGLFCRTLETGRTLEHNPTEVIETASTVKIPILLALLDQAQRKKTSLRRRIDLNRSHVGRNASGLLQSMYFNAPFTLYNLAFLMMSVSDNAATNAIIELVGFKEINSYIQRLGATNTRLLMPKVDFPSRFPKNRRPKMGESTPREMADIVELLVTGQALDRVHTTIAMKFMQRIQHSTFGRRLPPRQIRKYGSKTGSIYLATGSNVALAEAGYIMTKSGHTHVFSLFATLPPDPVYLYSPEASNRTEFARVAGCLYDDLEPSIITKKA